MRPRCSQPCGLHHPTTRGKKQGGWGSGGGETGEVGGVRAVHVRETETVLRSCVLDAAPSVWERAAFMSACGERWREVARGGDGGEGGWGGGEGEG